MQRVNAPGTATSVKFSNGTRVQPMRRAAKAGNCETRSGVSVNSADATSSERISFSVTISRKSRSVAASKSVASSRSTVIAPHSFVFFFRRFGFIGDHAQRRYFARGGVANLARRERAQSDRSEPQPRQTNDGMTKFFEHAPDLPVAPFVDRHVDARCVAPRGDDAQLRRLCRPVIELHPALHVGDLGGR